MKSAPTREQAIRWLEEQLEVLGRLRNATTRDNTFRQWRQDSLTVIQRIWPGDHSRADRLGRVPFTSPLPKADDRTAREHYDRGCDEARKILKMWITEIRHHGVLEGEAPEEFADVGPPEMEDAITLSEHDETSFSIEEDEDEIDLTSRRGGAIPEPARPRELDLSPSSAKGSAKSEAASVSRPEPASSKRRPATPASPRTPAPSARRASSEAPTVSPSSASPAGSDAKKKAGPARGKGRLKDMLGFSTPPPTPVNPTAPERGSRATSMDPARSKGKTSTGPEPSTPARETPRAPVMRHPVLDAIPTGKPPARKSRKPTPPDDLADSIAEALQRAQSETRATNPRGTAGERGAVARPNVPQRSGAEGATPRRAPAGSTTGRAPAPSSASAPSRRVLPMVPVFAPALQAIANELDTLGVPEAHRESVRRAWSDITKHVETGRVNWALMQRAVSLVMSYPPLARRALPVLLRLLDAAA
jgi:hypothetical protein